MKDRILIIDDDPEFRRELRDLFDGYQVLEAGSGRDALVLLRKAHSIGVVVLDVMMPDVDGTELLRVIKQSDPELGIIILTGFGSKDVAIRALKNRADDFLEKTGDPGEIKAAVERLLDRRARDSAGDRGFGGKVAQVKRFLERNCRRKVTLAAAAEHVALSPKYLSKLFRRHAGIGFEAYKLAVKLKEARRLLTQGHNVNQAAEKLGYEHAGAFITRFKAHFGMTPSQFTMRYLRRERHGNRPESKKNRKDR